MPNFKVQGHFLQKSELLERSNPYKFLWDLHCWCTFNFFRRVFVRNVIKACDNYWGLWCDFIATSMLNVMLLKTWDVNECEIKVSKKFTQSEKLSWITFNWYLINATLNKHPLVGTWHVTFCNTFKSAIPFFLITNRVLEKR